MMKYWGTLALLLTIGFPSVAAAESLSLNQAIKHALTWNNDYLNLADQVDLAKSDYETARSVFKTHYGAATSSDARLGAETGSYYSFFMDKKNESGSGYRAGIYSSTFGENSLSELRFSYTLPFFKNPLDSQRLRVIKLKSILRQSTE